MLSSISLISNQSYNNKEYDDFSDEELVYEAKNGNERAERCLFSRYVFIIKRITSSFFIMGGSMDDLFQEAMIGLIKAVDSFNLDYGSSFRSYAEVCIRRQIISAIRKAKSYEVFNMNVTFYDFLDESFECSVVDELKDVYSSNPEDLLIDKEEKKMYLKRTSELLSDFEKNVLVEYGKGKSYEEIALTLGKSKKSIDNALQRIKKKINLNKDKIIFNG